MDQRGILRARVEARHANRLAELCEATGFNASQVVRLLLENARLEPTPMPTSVIQSSNKNKRGNSKDAGQVFPDPSVLAQ